METSYAKANIDAWIGWLVTYHTNLTIKAAQDWLNNVIVKLEMPGEFIDCTTPSGTPIKAYIPWDKFFVDIRWARHQE